MENEEIQKRQEKINDARKMLDFLEANPEVKLPFELTSTNGWTIYGMTKPEIVATVKAFGDSEKDFKSDSVEISKRFGLLILRIYTNRSTVCERIVVGTEEVPELTIPAQPEKVIPATVKEIVEWRCEPLLSNGNGHVEPSTETAEEFATV